MINEKIFTLFCEWYNENFADEDISSIVSMKPSDYDKCKNDKIIVDAIEKWYRVEQRDELLRSILDE